MKKRAISLLLTGVMAGSALMMGGCGSSDSGDADTFSYWITQTDGDGVYYDNYEENPAIQWLNQQYWDVDNHTIGTSENGENIQFTFQVPIAGSEADNYNTMISTGEYTDIIDLSMAGSYDTLIDEGILMDITEYVEKYMPDYVALLEDHPEWKAQCTRTDDEGNVHYYFLRELNDGPSESWDCYCYRRDWVADYAEPTSHVWDWDSEYVKQNGHPTVTPLDAAIASGNMEGWKTNEVTKFTRSEGENPNEDYTDNVIFPSGTSEPLTISDWEWMLEAFEKAIADRGWSDDTDSYGTSIYYSGFLGTGDLVSSFGGGTGTFYINPDGEVTYSGIEDNFKTYLDCMNTWYNNGWLDTRFETRASDMFFAINESGCTQGKVGMWLGTVATVGTTIRPSCLDTRDQEGAYVMGCSLPINDVYGTDEQKYKEPDALYQQPAGPVGAIGITNKTEEKNLEALFTYFNWCYTDEGALFSVYGLNKEQYESVDLDPDIYAEYGYTDGFYHLEDQNGEKTIVKHLDQSAGLNEAAFRPTRMTNRLVLTGHGDSQYKVDNNYEAVKQQAVDAYGKYTNTGGVTNYTSLFSESENEVYNSVNNPLTDYVNMEVPKLVKEGTGNGNWETYVDGINEFDIQSVCDLYQKYVDQALGQ